MEDFLAISSIMKFLVQMRLHICFHMSSSNQTRQGEEDASINKTILAIQDD